MCSEKKLRKAHRAFLQWLGPSKIYCIPTILQGNPKPDVKVFIKTQGASKINNVNQISENGKNKSRAKGARTFVGVRGK